ncbi:MAG: hypothetical protein H7Y00_10400 [Fimbriimonadaceae bacterium]|nr:hypothetical protein [Chitinophagales bacterium]
MKGILIKELSNGIHAAETYSKTYAVNDLTKGMYLLALKTRNDIVVKKMVIQ